MTATQTPCRPEADRFSRTGNVPDPPASPGGRRRYWDDTVSEAIGELRRRLGSTRDDIATQALLAIIDLEKHKMRHGRPVSGTHVSYLGDIDDDWGKPVPALPVPPDEPPAPPTHDTIPDCFDDTPRDLWEDVPVAQVSSATIPVDAATVSPTRERGPSANADEQAAVEIPEADDPDSRVGLTAAPAPTHPPSATPPPRPKSESTLCILSPFG